MTPKEKAKELVTKFTPCVYVERDVKNSKQHALSCVDEVLGLFEQNKFDSRYGYYEAVKQEIEKL